MADEDVNAGIPAPEGAAGIIDTDYEIGQDNIETQIGPFGLDVHNPVFLISGLSVVVFVIYALLAPEQAATFFGWLRPALTSTFDGFFLSSANIFVVFCLALIVSPYGSVRLGGAEATPDYGYVGWFSMLFAAGMMPLPRVPKKLGFHPITTTAARSRFGICLVSRAIRCAPRWQRWDPCCWRNCWS